MLKYIDGGIVVCDSQQFTVCNFISVRLCALCMCTYKFDGIKPINCSVADSFFSSPHTQFSEYCVFFPMRFGWCAILLLHFGDAVHMTPIKCCLHAFMYVWIEWHCMEEWTRMNFVICPLDVSKSSKLKRDSIVGSFFIIRTGMKRNREKGKNRKSEKEKAEWAKKSLCPNKIHLALYMVFVVGLSLFHSL